MSKALVLVVGSEAQATAEFVQMFDKFFDILNVSNFTNGTYHHKPFKHLYRSGDDVRLTVKNILNNTSYSLYFHQ